VNLGSPDRKRRHEPFLVRAVPSGGATTAPATFSQPGSDGGGHYHSGPMSQRLYPSLRLVTLNAASGEAVSAPSPWLQELGAYTR